MSIAQSSVDNILLSTLVADDYALIAPHLTRIPLPLRLNLHDAGKNIEWAYFPEDGIASIVSTEANGKQVEVGIFGREGLSATALVLGTDRSPHDVYMQIAGVSGLRIATVGLQRAMAASVSLHALLLRYVQTVMVQNTGSTAAAAGYGVEQRLARWLVMCHDRVSGDEVNLTHEFMSAMLGSRRAGVTVALQALENRQLVATKRGSVTICDRDGLKSFAGSSYGYAETEYERLIGSPIFKTKSDLAAKVSILAA